jgi:hypothetical protein
MSDEKVMKLFGRASLQSGPQPSRSAPALVAPMAVVIGCGLARLYAGQGCAKPLNC